jgi:thiol:disulfide interchange protein DsbD
VLRADGFGGAAHDRRRSAGRGGRRRAARPRWSSNRFNGRPWDTRQRFANWAGRTGQRLVHRPEGAWRLRPGGRPHGARRDGIRDRTRRTRPVRTDCRAWPVRAGCRTCRAGIVGAGCRRYAIQRSRNDRHSRGASGRGAAPADDEPGAIERSLAGGRLLAILPLFFALGLGLSFTPCVLPMVPILSAIIVGEGRDVRRPRAFALSVSYALGMALVYTALGVVAGLAGEGMAAALQNPWVLGAFAMLMVLLSGAMFGFYELQLPSALQTKLAGASERRSAGRMAGVFAMGAISALIVGPCVAAPLAGALVYISQTRDVAIGGAALFAMAMGMSVPLLLVGLSAGTLLPRAGRWMEDVKRAFGVLMLAMALWLASPVLPPVAQMLGWMVLALGCGVYLLRRDARMWPARVLGLLFLVGGALQLVGLATGARDPWSPLAQLGIGKHAPVAFQRIKSPADLDRAIAAANGRTVMLDFYADWCVSCKEMEKLTFTDPKVRGRLDRLVLLQADVTANDADDKALLKRFGLFGPPGILFFGADRAEVPRTRVIGYQNAAKFLASLGRAAP